MNMLKSLRNPSVSSTSMMASFLRENQDLDGNVTLDGLPTKLSIGPGQLKSSLSLNILTVVKNICNMGVKKTILLAKVLRQMNVAIEPNLPEHLTKMNSRLEEFFSVKNCLFETDTDTLEPHTMPVAFCTDVPSLIQLIKHERNLDESDTILKIVIDGGGGSLKVTLSLIKK